MLRALLVLCLLASAARADDIDDGIKTLVKAIPKRNATLLAPLAPIYVANVAWRSEPCVTQFGGRKTVDEAAIPAFLDCVAALDLKAQSMGATYEPATILMVVIDSDHHLRIDGTMAGVPPAPLVRPDALPARFQARTDVKPDDETRSALARIPGAVAYAAGVVCVDPTGAVDAVILHEVARAFPSYGRTVVKSVAAWKLPPFKVKGKPVRVCLPFSKQTAAAKHPHDEPPPRDSLGVLAELAIEDLRVAGAPSVPPDTTSRQTINNKRSDANGVWYVCLDTKGEVASVTQEKSTGYGVWDSAIRAAIAKWKFRPVESAAPFCARYTVSYEGH